MQLRGSVWMHVSAIPIKGVSTTGSQGGHTPPQAFLLGWLALKLQSVGLLITAGACRLAASVLSCHALWK